MGRRLLLVSPRRRHRRTRRQGGAVGREFGEALARARSIRLSQIAYAESLALLMLLDRCRGQPGDLGFVAPLLRDGLDAVFMAECHRPLTRETFLAGLEKLF